MDAKREEEPIETFRRTRKCTLGSANQELNSERRKSNVANHWVEHRRSSKGWRVSVQERKIHFVEFEVHQCVSALRLPSLAKLSSLSLFLADFKAIFVWSRYKGHGFHAQLQPSALFISVRMIESLKDFLL
ncbi:hypothetical protein KQX54_018369 [Cotesia glomerata]|uniref:Uncharacterized protein n=1 Tax=Cotesia glomerata TaxID=32391 RepID=A0AAV7I989_COTGL|nr:hypothetical protein KQX54_018369 [Cotesia glomerata]